MRDAWSRALPKILLAVGWVLFVAACLVGPVLHQLAWGYEGLAFAAGPALMFAALVLRRRWNAAAGVLRGRLSSSLRCVSQPGETVR